MASRQWPSPLDRPAILKASNLEHRHHRWHDGCKKQIAQLGASLAKKDKYLIGLDIGSTKTCVLIAEIDGEQAKFLALGAAESKGLRKGLIVNLDSTVSSIRRAVEEAEGVANVPVESALIGVAGN